MARDTVAALLEVGLGRRWHEFHAAFGDRAGRRASALLIETRREIISAWTLTGEADYLLHVYCEDLGALNRSIHQVLLPDPAVSRVQSQIVMDQLKEDGKLPT